MEDALTPPRPDVRVNNGSLGGLAMTVRLPPVAAAKDEAVRGDSHAALRVDVFVLAGDGPGLVRAVHERAPDARIVALGISGEEADVLPLAEAGIAGWLTREASVEDLCETVASAAAGEAVCSPRIAASLLRRVAALAADRRLGPTATPLTRRQREILALIDEGLSNKEIARRLSIELATVKNHVHNILEKLQVRRRAEAAALVREPVRQPRD
jgi:DNA-binding NarL/FixJ family response regulator